MAANHTWTALRAAPPTPSRRRSPAASLSPEGRARMDPFEALDEVVETRGQGVVLPPPGAPMEVARALVFARFVHPTTRAPVLHHWRGGWWRWLTTHWAESGQREVRAEAYVFTEHATYENGTKAAPWAP